jgi:hypothetical protein
MLMRAPLWAIGETAECDASGGARIGLNLELVCCGVDWDEGGID